MSKSRVNINSLANVGGKLLHIAIAFVLSPFLVHTLGDTRYGIWTIAMAFTGYMNLLDLGLSSAVTRYVAKYWASGDIARTNSIVSTAFGTFVLIGVVIVAISPLMSSFVVGIVNIDAELEDVVRLLIIIMSFDIAVFILGGVMTGLFGGLQRYVIVNITQFCAALFKAIMWYTVLVNGGGLTDMGLVAVVANVLSVVFFYLYLKRNVPELRFSRASINRGSLSQIIHYSKFTFVAMLANQLIYYSDAFVIGIFMNAAAVTYYSIPWTLAEYCKKITLALAQTYTPAISESEAMGDKQRLVDLYFTGTRYVLLISNLLCVGLLVLGGAFIGIWMGPEYRVLCQDVLLILVFNVLVSCPQQISYSLLQGLGKQRGYAYLSVAVSIINLVLSILLVQRYGIIGVAIGAAVPQVIFQLFVVPRLTLRTLGVSYTEYFRRTLAPSMPPALLLAGLLWLFRDWQMPEGYPLLLAFAAAGGAAYLLACFALLLTKPERDVVISVLRRRFAGASTG